MLDAGEWITPRQDWKDARGRNGTPGSAGGRSAPVGRVKPLTFPHPEG
jgi:hypothetical protein